MFTLNIFMKMGPFSSISCCSRVNCIGKTVHFQLLEIYINGMELEESTCLTSDYTTKPQSSRQYGTGTKTEI